MYDYIDGDGFKNLCDCSWNEHLPDKNVIILYANTHDRIYALNVISKNKEKNFILVTHNSDDEISKTDIPENLIRWFGINVNYDHPKISSIPIGLENPHWHPHKRQILANANNNKQRINKAFAQFNPITYPLERVSILKDILNNNIYADHFSCLNGKNFSEYVDNLTQYKYCLCPRGNGIDTHRLWECMYLNCIPIVKKHLTHKFKEKLPILFIDCWSQVTKEFLDSKHVLEYYDISVLSMGYWKEKIYNETNIN